MVPFSMQNKKQRIRYFEFFLSPNEMIYIFSRYTFINSSNPSESH